MTQVNDPKTPHITPGYPVSRLAKALTAAETHGDPETRERARQKASKWLDVISGILDGSLNVGSRTPLDGVPCWATPEVVTGGFVTGRLLAGGPLSEHERQLAASLSLEPVPQNRELLNMHYLGDEGIAGLQERLRTGCYHITVPEEGAFLVVAWLVSNNGAAEARSLLEQLAPYFSRLRFFPAPADSPRPFGSRVCVQSAAGTIDALEDISINPGIMAQKEAIQVWNPMYDQVVRLFLETVEGELPFLLPEPGNPGMPGKKNNNSVSGGWPCQIYPKGWRDRAKKLLSQYKTLRKVHRLCGKPDRKKENFARLRHYLQRRTSGFGSLDTRDIARIRMILARYIAKRGSPDSPQCHRLRNQQAVQTAAPAFQQIAGVVIPRLKRYPGNQGIEDPNAVTQPVTQDEALHWKIDAGTLIPLSIQRKIQRCRLDTIDALVESRIITSGETLANVLPQLTSRLHAGGISDPSLRRLYADIYSAFRRRRSLLLLNLESQIKIEELPWVATIDAFRRIDISTQELARQALQEVAFLTIVSFPHVILPNKLISEFHSLAKRADLHIPFVEEIAADIFMGEFSPKYHRAAAVAADLMEGTLYQTYYNIDYSRVRHAARAERAPKRWGWKASAEPFATLCAARAGVTVGGWDAAKNGKIIEQQQVITTQNLAFPFTNLDLGDALSARAQDLAQRCFMWICKRQQATTNCRHDSLIMLKNTAYAWRQMVFFLSFLPPAEVRHFFAWAREYFGTQKEEFQNRFRPALHELVTASEFHYSEEKPQVPRKFHCFLGWSKDAHPLLKK
ncbi:MAG: hypothetical protein GY765_16185 [bacterium]|nr:hypothetical protein [bacterium]